MKVKVSATVSPDRLARAKQVTGSSNVSDILDRGLEALIRAEQERAHAAGYQRTPQGRETIDKVDSSVWADLPWDEE